MTLNHLMMVERYPNLNKEVGRLIRNCEIFSLLDRKNLSGGQLPPVLRRWHVSLLSPPPHPPKKRKKEKRKKFEIE
jgi:hypothetical protein